MHILAVDGGQSGSRWSLGTEQGDDVPLRTDAPLWPQLCSIIERSPSAEGVAFGLTGYVAGRESADELADMLGVPVWIAHDSVTSHLGALGTLHGASVAAGTGAVAFATSNHGAHQVDGNGWILGDQGSGFWIGAEAIREALRQADGRSAETALRREVEHTFGELRGLYMRVQASPTRVADIAAFARTVLELDDPAAHAIATRAGNELGNSVVAALRGAGWSALSEAHVRMLGGVLSNSTVQSALRETVVAAGVLEHNIDHVPGGSLIGASMLPSLGAQHPLAAHIERAG